MIFYFAKVAIFSQLNKKNHKYLLFNSKLITIYCDYSFLNAYLNDNRDNRDNSLFAAFKFCFFIATQKIVSIVSIVFKTSQGVNPELFVFYFT